MLAVSFSSSILHSHIQASGFQGKIHRGPLSSVASVGKCLVTGAPGRLGWSQNSLQSSFRNNWYQPDSATRASAQILRAGSLGPSKPPSLGLCFRTLLPSTRRLDRMDEMEMRQIRISASPAMPPETSVCMWILLPTPKGTAGELLRETPPVLMARRAPAQSLQCHVSTCVRVREVSTEKDTLSPESSEDGDVRLTSNASLTFSHFSPCSFPTSFL